MTGPLFVSYPSSLFHGHPSPLFVSHPGPLFHGLCIQRTRTAPRPRPPSRTRPGGPAAAEALCVTAHQLLRNVTDISDRDAEHLYTPHRNLRRPAAEVRVSAAAAVSLHHGRCTYTQRRLLRRVAGGFMSIPAHYRVGGQAGRGISATARGDGGAVPRISGNVTDISDGGAVPRISGNVTDISDGGAVPRLPRIIAGNVTANQGWSRYRFGA